MSTDPGSELLLGRVIAGKYAIEKVIGDGSCGVVYRATQRALAKQVAIKVLHRDMSADAAVVERFHREARAASQLSHPNSIDVFDFGQEPDGLLYLVMEYAPGRDLLTLMNEEGQLPPRRIVNILRQVLAALAVAHDRGIVHRDLKPENILLVRGESDDGEPVDIVKVCDFGIATLATTTERITGRGLIVGTPEYISPEQALGGQFDGRADLYALGAVLYQLLTHRVPFRGASPIATVLEQINNTVTPPSAHVPTVDPELERICLRALEKDPGRRFANAREMRAALTNAATRAPIPRRRPALFVAAAALVAMAAALVAFRPKESAAPVAIASPRGAEIETTAVTDSRPMEPEPASASASVVQPEPAVKKPRAVVKKRPPKPEPEPEPVAVTIDDGF